VCIFLSHHRRFHTDRLAFIESKTNVREYTENVNSAFHSQFLKVYKRLQVWLETVVT